MLSLIPPQLALCKLGWSFKLLYACFPGALPVVRSFTRVDQPTPTQRHPLAGVWRTTGMLHSCIMVVRYDFSRRAASIAATQVIMDHHLNTSPPWALHRSPATQPQCVSPAQCGVVLSVNSWLTKSPHEQYVWQLLLGSLPLLGSCFAFLWPSQLLQLLFSHHSCLLMGSSRVIWGLTSWV